MVKSKKQAKFFGAVAGGATTYSSGKHEGQHISLSQKSAKKELKGMHYSDLPESSKKKRKKK